MLKRKKGRKKSEVNDRCSDMGKEDREKRKPIGYDKADKKKINTKKFLTLIRKTKKKDQNPKLFVVWYYDKLCLISIFILFYLN